MWRSSIVKRSSVRKPLAEFMFLGLRMTEGISSGKFPPKVWPNSDRILSADQIMDRRRIIRGANGIPALHAQRACCSPIRSSCISCRFNGKSNRRTSAYSQFSREILEDPMADNSLDKIRIDHIGSLVRPAKLKDVFARYDRGQATHARIGKSARRRNPRGNPKTRGPRLSGRHRR